MQSPLSILIVDDQEDVRKLIRMILSPEGYELLEAHDGKAAITQIQTYRPDLILLDIMMPGYPNGLELLDIVKKNKVMTTKIVMISAKGQFDDVVAAAKLRCDAYIIKPFTRQHLLDTIKTVLDSEEGGTTS
jgi:DNA-binding response OmpR family regulator